MANEKVIVSASSAPAMVDWLDRAAVGASAACLLHCLALPLVLAILPFVGTWMFVPERLHLWMLAFAVPVALLALVAGRTLHGRNDPMIIGVTGLALLAIGAILLSEGLVETVVTVTGGLILARAHWLNAHLRRTCCVHP